jgi:hypothetical protein
MIGDTITVTYNGVANTLDKINQDNYTSEYLKRTATEELRVRIRHSNESVVAGKPAYERHQVDLTRTVFATSTTVERVYQTYMVIRLQKGSDPDVAELVAAALCGLTNASFTDKVVGWQS